MSDSSEELVKAIMQDDNIKASKSLEKLLLTKCAKKIAEVLNQE